MQMISMLYPVIVSAAYKTLCSRLRLVKLLRCELRSYSCFHPFASLNFSVRATPADDHLDRISKHKGVKGVLIAGHDGSIHKSTLDEHLTHEYADMIPSLTALARNMVRELDPQNDLEFLSVRSTKQEIMVAAKNDYVLIVIQEADSSQ